MHVGDGGTLFRVIVAGRVSLLSAFIFAGTLLVERVHKCAIALRVLQR